MLNTSYGRLGGTNIERVAIRRNDLKASFLFASVHKLPLVCPPNYLFAWRHIINRRLQMGIHLQLGVQQVHITLRLALLLLRGFYRVLLPKAIQQTEQATTSIPLHS